MRLERILVLESACYVHLDNHRLAIEFNQEPQKQTRFVALLDIAGVLLDNTRVYCRHFSCLADAQRAAVRYGKVVPPNGKVDFYFLTDRQMGVTMSFFGAQSRKEEIYDVPEQGELF